jgi:PAS domain S-box-containing protein
VRRALQGPWVARAVLAELLLLVLDVVTGHAFLVRSLYLLPVLVLAVRGRPRDVALVGVLAVVLVAVSIAWGGGLDDSYFVPVSVVTGGSLIAWWAARERAAAEAERRQLRLIADAARITDGVGEIDEALRRLVDLLVPELADAAWIDVVAPGGGIRRLAARLDGEHREEIERWLLERPEKAPGTLSRSGRVLRGEGAQLSVLDTRTVDAIVVGPEDRRLLERSGLRTTMAVPLSVRGTTLGALSLGVGRSGRYFDAADLHFAALLAGRAALALGNAQLVARLSAAQQRLDRILGALVEAVTVTDARGKVVYANHAAARLLGVEDADAVLAAEHGELADRFVTTHEDGSPLSVDELPSRRVIRGEQPEPLLTRTVVKATGEVRWHVTKATPLRDEDGSLLAVNIIEDVTQEKEAELRERFLTEAGQALASSLDHEETLQRVTRLAVPRLADWCAVELPDERGDLQSVALAHADRDRIAEGMALRERYPPERDAPTGSYAVLRTGRSELYAEVTDEMLAQGARDAEHLQRTRRLDIGSVMLVPMVAGGSTLGVMTFVRGGGRRYTEDDLPFAEDLAARAAVAVENARLYTERAQVAHTLQASLLPEQLPRVPGWRTAADYRAGQVGAEVGGDFYDLFPVDGGAMVILGDVTGKGVTAAALTSLVRHTAQTGAYFDPRPSAVLALVNRALRRRPQIAPVTMLAGLLRDGSLTLAAGGHPLPVLRRTGDPARKVGETGLLLGAVDAYAGVRDVTVPLAPGDTVLLYTDGVTDTPGQHGRFGEEALRAAVENAPCAPAALLEHLTETLAAFQRGTVVDDRAMLALQYTGTPEATGGSGGGRVEQLDRAAHDGPGGEALLEVGDGAGRQRRRLDLRARPRGVHDHEGPGGALP